MFEETSRMKPVSITRLHTSSPKMFFTHQDRITEIIRKAVLVSRKKQTKG